jgi:peptide/nickel transport system permease protein
MMAMAVSILIAIPIGVLSAVKQDSLIDHLTRSFAILILAIPSFWLGLMVIVYGFAWFGWTPPLRYHDPWQDPIANLQHLIAPALILGAGLSGTVLRLTRTTLLEVLRQDYMRTARAKGLGTVSILVTHAMRNSLIPIITVIGVQIPVIVGGTVVLEKIFSVPGMGSFLLAAVQSRDYPVIQAIVIISATVVILSTLAVDLIYPLIDPRIRVR